MTSNVHYLEDRFVSHLKLAEKEQAEFQRRWCGGKSLEEYMRTPIGGSR